MLEREDELAAVGWVVEEAAEGCGRLLVIEGPAGIGKTALLARVREAAEERWLRVLAARAVELERDFPFGLVRELLEPVMAEAPQDSRRELLAGAAALAAPLVDPTAATEAPPAADTYATLHGLYWLCANLAAQQPLAVAVDDAQWADAPSLRFLNFLARRIEGLPLLVAVATRPPESAADPGLLAELVQDPAVLALRPAPLSPDASAAFIRERFGEEAADAFCEACHEATGGNPFLLDELTQTLASGGIAPNAEAATRIGELGPRSVARMLVVRLERAHPAARALARGVAVLGDDAELRDAACLPGIDPTTAVAAADAITRAGIFEPRHPLAFVHPIMRAAVYEDIAPAERASLHGSAARLLAEGRGDPDEVAAHLLATDPGGDAWVVETLRSAAGAALARGAPESAVTYLRRALEEPPAEVHRAEVLLELGSAETAAFMPEAVEHLSQALELSAEPQEREGRLRPLPVQHR